MLIQHLFNSVQHSVKSTASDWLIFEINERATVYINMPYFVLDQWPFPKKMYGFHNLPFSTTLLIFLI